MDNPAPDEIERLLVDLKDDRRDVRSRAAYELGKHDDPRALAPLVAALSDHDKFVRSWAAGALGKAGPSAVPALVEVLGSPDQSVGYYAALALAEHDDVRAVPLLARAVQEGDWDIRPSAASALAGLGDPTTLPNRVLSEAGIACADRVRILASLREVAYTDDQVQIHYSIPDVADFCRERSQSVDETVRTGAVETLHILEQPHSDSDQVGSVSAEVDTLTAESPALAASAPNIVDDTEDGSAGRRPVTQDTEKPKRSLWDRLTGR